MKTEMPSLYKYFMFLPLHCRPHDEKTNVWVIELKMVVMNLYSLSSPFCTFFVGGYKLQVYLPAHFSSGAIWKRRNSFKKVKDKYGNKCGW